MCYLTAGTLDVQALVRWGGAMLELAHYKQGDDSIKMINDVSRGSP